MCAFLKAKVESELYDSIFGEKDRKAGKMKERSRQRKYGTHALASHLMGKPGGEGGGAGGDGSGTDPSPQKDMRNGSSGVGGKGSGDRKGAKKR